jgi:hypothetical protein
MGEDQKPKGNEKFYSLSPLTFDEALDVLLRAEPKPAKKKKRKGSKAKTEVSAT